MAEKKKIMALLHTGPNKFTGVEVIGPDEKELDKMRVKIPGQKKHRTVNMYHLYLESTSGQLKHFKWKEANKPPEPEPAKEEKEKEETTGDEKTGDGNTGDANTQE